jgi:hypothetical protein
VSRHGKSGQAAGYGPSGPQGGYGPSSQGQQPIGYGPPPGYYGPPQPPPRKSRAGKVFLFGCGGPIALVVLIIVIVAVASSGGSSSNNASSGSSARSANSGSSSTFSGSSTAGIGSKARDGKFQFVVTRISHQKNVGDVADGLGDTAQGEYTVLHVTVSNIGAQAQDLDDSAQYVYDARGRQFSASSSADIDGNGSNGGGVLFNQINPGDTVHGKIYFDLPTSDKAIRAVLHDSVFSDGVTVSLRS